MMCCNLALQYFCHLLFHSKTMGASCCGSPTGAKEPTLQSHARSTHEHDEHTHEAYSHSDHAHDNNEHREHGNNEWDDETASLSTCCGSEERCDGMWHRTHSFDTLVLTAQLKRSASTPRRLMNVTKPATIILAMTTVLVPLVQVTSQRLLADTAAILSSCAASVVIACEEATRPTFAAVGNLPPSGRRRRPAAGIELAPNRRRNMS